MENELYKAKNLSDHLTGWRKRTVYLNGEKFNWDSVLALTGVIVKSFQVTNRNTIVLDENAYEFHIWGCLRTGLPSIEYSAWFTYGKSLNTKGDWQCNKDRIKYELNKKLHPFRFCPALNPDLIQEVIQALPSIVNPTNNKNWKFIVTYTAESNCLIWKTQERGWEEIKYLKGVEPNGGAFLKDISSSIKRKVPNFIKSD